jgi:LPXTG-motif cell wall-anchored protein
MAVRITGAGVALTVGIILVTALIIGGLFWAKHAGEQARSAETAKIAKEQLEGQSNDGVALNQGDKSNNQSSNSSNGGSNGSGNAGSTGNSSTTTNSQPQSSNELPQTGPSDFIPSLLIVGLLTFGVASYVTSRNALRQL